MTSVGNVTSSLRNKSHTLTTKAVEPPTAAGCCPASVLPSVLNSRCHAQSGQEMDQIRLCDIGRRNIGPTVCSVDRVLENSSETAAHAIDKRRVLGALGWRAIRMFPMLNGSSDIS